MSTHARRARGPKVLVAAGVLLAAAGVGIGVASADGTSRPDQGAPSDPARVEAVRVSPAAPSTSEVPAAPEPGVPLRLEIPKLGVGSPIAPIRAQGETLDPPDDPATTGWWADGVRPGAARGTALLTGHTVHDGGGALDDLEQLAVGDRIVVRSRGALLRYEVTKVTVYSKGEFAEESAGVLRQHGAHRLAVVTCEDWDGSQYLSNVVAQAEPTAVVAR